MGEITTIGLDIAKHVFHAHGVDERGRMLFSKRISRSGLLAFFARQQRCVVALEASGGAIIGAASCSGWATRCG
jgi:transposase